jgi:hypothetical protein
MSRMPNQPFFEISGDEFVPTNIARGFWGPGDNLHGRVVIGLLAHEIERQHGDPEFTPARLTVDLYRLPDLSPAQVATRVVRQSHRIRVVDAEFISGGVSSGRATCQLLRRAEQPAGNVWRAPAWDAPRPEDTPVPDNPTPIRGMWEMRPIPSKPDDRGPRRTWLREIRALVDGKDHTPFTRVATGADYVSPYSNSGDQGLGFINSDVTVYLHRALVGEWVGYEVTNHQSSGGVAIGQCMLHDIEGPVGFASCAALAQRRAPTP